MAFLPQIHNTEIITKLLLICYINILYEGVTVHYVVFFGLAQTHEMTRAAHTLATPVE